MNIIADNILIIILSNLYNFFNFIIMEVIK